MKKQMLLFFALIINLTTLQAQWLQKASHGGGPRGLCASFSIGDKVYVFGGSTTTSNVYNELWEYNALTNAWSQKATFPGGPRVASTAFSIGTKGYIGMGSNFVNYYNDFWEYDPSTDTWLQKGNFPGGARQSATGLAIGSKGYVCGGLIYSSTTVLFSDFWEYTPSTDTWLQKSDIPGPTRSDVAACAVGNMGYLGLGADKNTTSYTDFYSYNPVNDTWALLSSPSGSTTGASAMFAIGTDCYLVGGHNWANNSTSNTTQRYITTTDTWTNAPTFPGGSVYYHVAGSANGKGYVGTGGNAQLAPKGDWWQYSLPNTLTLTSVNDERADYKSIHVYPNPFKDQITISFTSKPSSGSCTFRVNDLLGREVFRARIENGTTSEYNLQLPSALPCGIYSFTLSDEKQAIIGSGKMTKD